MKLGLGFGLAVLAATATLAQENKPVIGVAEIETSVAQLDTENIRTSIETAISKTGKFTLMERSRLDTLLAEQGLSMGGITEGIDSLGGFSGVDYLLYGRLTHAGLENKSQFLFNQCEATLGLDIRTVDAKTAEIRLTESVRLSKNVATADAESDACRGVSLTSVEELSIDAAERVAGKLTVSLFPIKIASVDGSRRLSENGHPPHILCDIV